MAGWTARVETPFADEPLFWRAVALSVVALGCVLVIAVTGAVLAAPQAVIALVVPAGLLVAAAVCGRTASAHARSHFADRTAWREAERHAVAVALRDLAAFRR